MSFKIRYVCANVNFMKKQQWTHDGTVPVSPSFIVEKTTFKESDTLLFPLATSRMSRVKYFLSYLTIVQ